MPLNEKQLLDEFHLLKRQEYKRNQNYYLLRQAVKGNFRWPRDWPNHIERVKRNLCKPITERFTTYLVGKGFSWNIDRPNSLEYRVSAEQAEKILRKVLDLSQSDLQFEVGARIGSQLGRTVYKVYKRGQKGAEHACFTYCQPDYFYGIPSGDAAVGDFSTVYYSYPLDKLEARRLFGDGNYKTEYEMDRENFYDFLPEQQRTDNQVQSDRRVPVLEVWTPDDYYLNVGGVVKWNGENPNKWSESGEGFIPFVVIENIRNAGDGYGESDIEQARELNERLNYIVSRKNHIVSRWLQPTAVWEGAPQNFAEVISQTIGGGGVIPTRIGSRLYFLSYDKPNPAVLELEQSLYQGILEVSGMSEIALQGTVQGSINTGPALQAQFQPVLSTVEKKRKEWEVGIEKLSAMLLQVQEAIGDSSALGQAVVGQEKKSEDDAGGELVQLSGQMIAGLRRVSLSWPGVLPKDDIESARLELEKAAQGFQSIYTTLEKLGEEFPDDEIARIRWENQDPNLRGQAVAEQTRANAPMIRAQAQAAEMGGGAAPEADLMGAEGGPAVEEEELLGAGNLGARLRDLSRRAKPSLDEEGDIPVIQNNIPYGPDEGV